MKTRQQICKYITSQSWFKDFNYNLIKARKINFYVYLYVDPKYTGLDILERLIVNAFLWADSVDGFNAYAARDLKYKEFYYGN